MATFLFRALTGRELRQKIARKIKVDEDKLANAEAQQHIDSIILEHFLESGIVDKNAIPARTKTKRKSIDKSKVCMYVSSSCLTAYQWLVTG